MSPDSSVTVDVSGDVARAALRREEIDDAHLFACLDQLREMYNYIEDAESATTDELRNVLEHRGVERPVPVKRAANALEFMDLIADGLDGWQLME